MENKEEKEREEKEREEKEKGVEWSGGEEREERGMSCAVEQ